MNKKLLLRVSNTNDPYRNLAAEEYLTETVSPGEPLLFLWQNKPCVVIGKNQSSRAECDLCAMETAGIPLVRRLSGGGAVWHDEGNLCFSFISHKDDHSVPLQLELIAAACDGFGIDARVSGRNDIEVEGKKFSGNAFYTIGSNKCHHGTVLINADRERLSRYLTVTRQKLQAKGIPSVTSRVVNLCELSPSITVQAFAEALAALWGGVPCPMPDESLYLPRAAALSSAEWLLGADPPYTDRLEIRTDRGLFTLLIEVRGGRVQQCRVFTDAMDPAIAQTLEARITGTEFYEQRITEMIRSCQ